MATSGASAPAADNASGTHIRLILTFPLNARFHLYNPNVGCAKGASHFFHATTVHTRMWWTNVNGSTRPRANELDITHEILEYHNTDQPQQIYE